MSFEGAEHEQPDAFKFPIPMRGNETSPKKKAASNGIGVDLKAYSFELGNPDRKLDCQGWVHTKRDDLPEKDD